MELKYAAELLQYLYDIRYQQCGNVPAYGKSHEAEALQIAISHLETLQKVKEAGGVKRWRNYEHSERQLESGVISHAGLRYNAGWNDCLDAVHAELIERLERLEDIFAKTKGCKPNQEDCSFGKCHSWGECEILAKAIQELFLGKKEE